MNYSTDPINFSNLTRKKKKKKKETAKTFIQTHPKRKDNNYIS